MKEFVEERKKKLIEAFSNLDKLLISYSNREPEIIRDYYGRELLELIQNADDEMIEELPKEIDVFFDGDILRVSNYGRPFDKDGVDSLMFPNASEKSSRKVKTIGNKGTGFRSILAWAESVQVHSENLHIEFSRDYANEYVNTRIPDNSIAPPIMSFPEWIDNESDTEFTTDIIINLHQDYYTKYSINKQITAFRGEILLFLNKTESVTITNQNEVYKFTREDSESGVIIKKYINSQCVASDIWLCKKQDGMTSGESYSVVVARRKDKVIPENNVLFSYFPTEIDFPYPFLLHGDFELGSNRNHLIKNSDKNKAVLNTAMSLIVETAMEMTMDGQEATYDALRLLLLDNKLHRDLEDYNFESLLINAIKWKKIFPTVNNTYIDLSSEPVFYKSKLANYLSGESFWDLLKPTNNKLIIKYLENNDGIKTYGPSLFSNRINEWAKTIKYSEEQIVINAKIIYEIFETIRILGTDFDEYNCKLVYATDGKLASRETPIYIKLEDDSDSIKLPSFTRLRYIHPTMKKELYKMFQYNAGALERHFDFLGVNEYNFEEVINKITLQIDNKIKTDNEKAREYVFDSLVWLWKNRKSLQKIDGISVYLPTRQNNIARSEKLYYGKEYNNFLCENLFSEIKDDLFVADIKTVVNIDEKEIDEVTDFLRKLLVAAQPRKVLIDINRVFNYKKDFKDIIEFPVTIKDKSQNKVFSKKSEWDSWTELKGYVSSYEYFGRILTSAKTVAILEWIISDKELQRYINSKNDLGASLEIRWGRKQNFVPFPSNKVYPYVLRQLQISSWITVGEKRYSPRNCILQEIGDVFKPNYVGVNISELISDSDINITALKQLLLKIGVYESISNLPENDVFELLDKLSDKDSNGDIAEKIYLKIISSNLEPDTSAEERFDLDEFYVYTSNGYQPASDTYYLHNHGTNKKIAKLYNLIKVPVRNNVERIYDWFGVNKLSIETKVIGNPQIHVLNHAFSQDLRDYKTAVFCFRIDSNPGKKEERKLQNLRIMLCESLHAQFNGKDIELDNFDYVTENGNTFFIKIPSSYTNNDLLSYDMGDAIANIMCEVFDLSEDNIFKFASLYRNTPNDRRRLIQRELHDSHLWNRAYAKLVGYSSNADEFIDILKNITGANSFEDSIHISNINFENINNLSDFECSELILLLRDINVDVDEFNKHSSNIKISLVDYFKNKVNAVKAQLEDRYKSHCYYMYINSSIEDKEHLLDKIYGLSNIDVEITDSVYFDYHDAVIKALEITTEDSTINLSDLLNRNTKEWYRLIGETDVDPEFINDVSIQSLLYYAEYPEITKRYMDWKSTNSDIAPSVNTVISATGNTKVYDVITTPDISVAETSATKTPKSTGFTKNQSRDKNKKIIGLRGEEIVKKELEKIYKTVNWVSENAKESGANGEGIAGLGYDFLCVDDCDNAFYIEVKASTGSNSEISFHLSENEYNTACIYKKNYIIYYVPNVNSSERRVYVLKNLVDENGSLNNEQYGIKIERNYLITANAETITQK